jgi:hypothetical protein
VVGSWFCLAFAEFTVFFLEMKTDLRLSKVVWLFSPLLDDLLLVIVEHYLTTAGLLSLRVRVVSRVQASRFIGKAAT